MLDEPSIEKEIKGQTSYRRRPLDGQQRPLSAAERSLAETVTALDFFGSRLSRPAPGAARSRGFSSELL